MNNLTELQNRALEIAKAHNMKDVTPSNIFDPIGASRFSVKTYRHHMPGLRNHLERAIGSTNRADLCVALCCGYGTVKDWFAGEEKRTVTGSLKNRVTGRALSRILMAIATHEMINELKGQEQPAQQPLDLPEPPAAETEPVDLSKLRFFHKNKAKDEPEEVSVLADLRGVGVSMVILGAAD